MGLRDIAAADTKSFLEDDSFGFGWPITVIAPGGTSQELKGYSNDIGQLIDPDTGQAVSGRLASVALSIETLTDAGLGLPQGIEDATSKPWIVEFNDVNGNPFTFKVQQSNPDRAVGVVTLILELYKK